ncbi:MAG: YfhO family protein, partial [Bacteroidota bacterium]
IIGFLNFFGVPSGIFLLHLIGFYILALCLRVKPLIAVVGAFAFALATYEIVILQAGHNSKATTVALMAPVVGAFIYAYRSNWKWGALLSGLFMSFQLASNHLQVTYYLGFLLFGLGIYQLVMAVRTKELKKFAITSGAILGAYFLALFINYGNLTLTNDYAKHSIRGGNDVTINADGTPSKISTEGGLDKEYITNWSYGVGESFTLVSPYVKGSASVSLEDSGFKELIENSDRSAADINQVMTAPFPVYWGEQPMTSGPVYIGVVMCFLLVLGMIFIKDRSKWVFLSISLLALGLSWGKNFMGLTEFFIDNVPGYNKFRTVTIIMVLIELCVPVIAVMLLQRLCEEREAIREAKKPFLITSGVFLFLLVAVKLSGLGDNYTCQQDIASMDRMRQSIMQADPNAVYQQLGIDMRDPKNVDVYLEGQLTAMKGARNDIFQSSMNRSILFGILGIGLVALFFYTAVNTNVIIAGLGLLVLIDLIPVDRKYLSSVSDDAGQYKNWIAEEEAKYPVSAGNADNQIVEAEISGSSAIRKAVERGERAGKAKADQLEYTGTARRRVIDAYRFAELGFATNYRVFDYNNPWGGTRTNYFHKALGGYHGAKLRNIQNVFDFHLANGNNKVFNLLNVKYFIQGDEARPNPGTLGNAWLVKKVKPRATPNDEIRALGAEFNVVNKFSGNLLVNGEIKQSAQVYGGERVQYLIPGRDTLQVQLPNGLTQGMTAVMVMDTNGVTNLVPELTLQADTADSFTRLVDMAIVEDFDPSTEAVMLKSEASKLRKLNFTGKGTINMTSYAPNKLTYTANVEGDQLAVFSEIYYPEGWKAIVNGKEQEILKVNYLLRGLQLKSGKNRIEFVFDLPKYRKSNNYAGIGSVLLLLLFGGLGWMEWRKRKVA